MVHKIPGKTAHMRLDGPRLNVVNCDVVKAEGKALVGGGATQLVVDMQNVTFVDSSGIGALVSLRKAVGDDGKVVLVNVQEFVGRVIELIKLQGVFEIQRAA